MAALSVLFGASPRRGRVGLVEFDATVRELHTKESEITDHPIEDGSVVTDHVRTRPDAIEINGVVSDTPIVILASLAASSPLTDVDSPAQNRVEIAYAELRRIQDAGEQVDVFTTLREYTGMVIQSSSVPRDARLGNSLDVTLRLRQITVAETERVDAPVPVTKANEKSSNQGQQTSTPATEQQSESSQSILKQGVEGIRGIFGGP